MIKPINLEALGKWVKAVPEDVRKDITKIAPMLSKLGYDPYAYPPNYGKADPFVHDNTIHIRQNEDEWRQKALEVKGQGKQVHKPLPSPAKPDGTELGKGKEPENNKQPQPVPNNNEQPIPPQQDS